MSDELKKIIKDVREQLNPDGGGYRTGEALNLIVENARKGCGYLNTPILELSRAGAATKLKEYSQRAPKINKAIHAIEDGQTDLAEIVDDFGWMLEETSLDESSDAVRKLYRDLTYLDVVAVIKLKRLKARQTADAADRLESVVDQHPEWASRPDMTMAEIVGLTP